MSLTKVRKWELETIIPIMTRDGNRNGEKNWTTNILITPVQFSADVYNHYDMKQRSLFIAPLVVNDNT